MPLHEKTPPVSGLEGPLREAARQAHYHAQEIIEACLYSPFGEDSEKIKAFVYREAYKIRQILTQAIKGEIRHQIALEAAAQEKEKTTQQAFDHGNQDDAPAAQGDVD
jgi:hypothetical protein